MFENYRNQVSSVNSQHANSRPKIEFIEPLWTMKDVTKWQTIEKRYDPYFRNLRGDPRNIGGGIHIDTREDKEEDAWDEEHFQNTGERLRVMLEAEPAEASVPEVHERLDDHGIVLNAYQPAVLAKPAIPARRGYPKIINGNPIAFSGPVNHKTEAGLITYLTESEEKTGDKIDMVQTILNLEKYANDAGYTYPQIKNFLRRLCQKKSGPKGFEHFESVIDPNEIANTLIHIYYEVAPINRINEVAKFSRKVGMSIHATAIQLRMLYQNLFSYISKPEERKKLVDDRVSNDILGFCHPMLATDIRRRRTYDIAMCVDHPLNNDLDIINTAEQMDVTLRPTAPLFIRQRDLQRIPTIECNNFDIFQNLEEYEEVDLNNFGPANDVNAIESSRFQPYFKKRKLDETANTAPDIERLAGIKLPTQTQSPAPTPQVPKPIVSNNSRAPSKEATKRKLDQESVLPNAPEKATADSITGRKRFFNTKANRRYSQSPMGTVTRYDKTETGFQKTRVGQPGTVGTRAVSRPPSRSNSMESNKNTQHQRGRSTSFDGSSYRQTRGSSRKEDTTGHRPEWKRSPSGNTYWKVSNTRHTSPSPARYSGRFESTSRPSRRRSKSGGKDILDNLLYWDGKQCSACDGPHHGATTCCNYICPRCRLNGKHPTEAHCDAMRDSVNQGNVAFHRPLLKRQSSAARTDPSINNVLVETQKSILELLGKITPPATAVETSPESPKN